MAHTLTPAFRYGMAAVPGAVLLVLLVIPEVRYQCRSCRGNLTDPQMWFWVTLLAGGCFGLLPWVLLHVLEAR